MDKNVFFEIISQLNYFSDVAANLDGLPNDEIGDFFEYLTKYLFLLHPFYVGSFSDVWLYSELDDQMKIKLNIPEVDKGIDLVLRTIDGKYVAVQAKYRTDVNTTVTWKELSTFAGQMQVSGMFHRGYYVTNTYGINSQIRRAKTIIAIYGDFFSDLPTEFFRNIERMNRNEHIIMTSLMPRPHQIELIENTIEQFKENSRATAVMACGTGKTLGAYWIDKQMENQLTIVVVPSLTLVSQFFSDWIHQSVSDGSDISYLLVGSDVDTEDQGHCQNGITVTTDELEIYEYIVMNLIDKKKKVVIISTYQSADKLQFGMTTVKYPDLIVFDEAHKTVGGMDKHFNFLMFDWNVKANKRLFLTATPKVYNGDDDTDVVSMDNRRLYGLEVYNYSTRRAINEGYLSNYRIMTMFVNDPYIEYFIKKNKLANVDDLRTDSHHLICAIMILKSIEEKSCNHILTYHNSIESSRSFSKLLLDIAKRMNMDDAVNVQSVDGSMSIAKRKRIFEAFCSKKHAVLTSSKVMNEGVNLPIVDSICFVDKRTSAIDIVQCIGRSLRLHKNKNVSNIIVPINCNDINDLDDNTIYGNLVNVLKSMADTDDSIKTYFELSREGKKMNGLLVHKGYFRGNGMVMRTGVDIDLDKWVDKLEMIIWKMVDGWDVRFKEVVEWVKDKSELPKRSIKNKTEDNLAWWCAYQRQMKRNGFLSQPRIDKLNTINGWYWESDSDNTWQKRYNSVLKWKCENNRFPRAVTSNRIEQQLGRWCSKQQQLYISGKLIKERKDKLELIHGWIWKTKKKPTADGKWFEICGKILDWVNLNDTLPDFISSNETEKDLALWCIHQQIDNLRLKLNRSQISKLKSIKGWTWKTSYDEIWNEIYDILIIWINGNKRLPKQGSKDKVEKFIGKWCCRQKESQKDNKLSKPRKNKLELINGWQWINTNKVIIKKTWNQRFNDLREWVSQNNRLPLKSSSNQEERSLGVWCFNRKRNKQSGKLSKDQIKKLESLPGWKWIEEKTNDSTWVKDK